MLRPHLFTWKFLLLLLVPVLGMGQARVAPGQLDLRGHDWAASPYLDLMTSWLLERPGAPPTHVQVPVSPGDAAAAQGMHATYSLMVLPGPDAPADLALCLREISTAFRVEVNGRELGRSGQPGPDRSSSIPDARALTLFIPPPHDTLRIRIETSNFHRRASGLLQAPRLGSASALLQRRTDRTLLGGLFIGLLLLNGVYQIMRHLLRRKERAEIVYGLWSLVSALHLASLHERWLYGVLGPGLGWGIAYRVELATLFGLIGLSHHFLKHFFEGTVTALHHRIVMGSMALCIAFVLVTPIWIGAWIDAAIPFIVLSFVISTTMVLSLAIRQRKDGARTITAAAITLILSIMADRFLIGVHVGSLHPVHYLLAIYVLSMAWILARRAARMDRRLLELTAALESQNATLEETVRERSATLTRIQEEKHALELEKRQRDLEVVVANNQMKAQLARNLIASLEELAATADSAQAKRVRSLIADLRGQAATETRLGVLEDGMDTANNEFQMRLQELFPQLSKTEREICTYLKLNLSSKDIAAIRQTNLNSINVARHRIRKKLGLDRDDELEAFIQRV